MSGVESGDVSVLCIRKINESLNQQSVEIDKQHWTEGRTDHQTTEVHTKGQEDRQERKSQTERQSDSKQSDRGKVRQRGRPSSSP